jgi:hypothetical protein
MGCTTAPRIDKSFTSRSQSERIKFIIIHYTFGNLDRSLETLTKNEVSSHYLLTDTDKPFFYKLVAESQQANHAGLSSWKIYLMQHLSELKLLIWVLLTHLMVEHGIPIHKIKLIS